MAANCPASKAMVSVAWQNATAYTHPTESCPVASSSGITAMTAARPRSVAIISRLRSTRSTQAPMTSPKRRYGTNSIAMVTPRFSGEPVSLNTSSGSANSVNELPRLEIVCPSQNSPKSPDSSQPRRPSVPVVMTDIVADPGSRVAFRHASFRCDGRPGRGGPRQGLRRRARPGRGAAAGALRQGGRPARPQRLRQDHAAALHRRPGAARRRRGPAGRPVALRARGAGAARAAPHRHGVPGRRPVPPSQRRRQRRLRPAARAAPQRPGRGGARAGGPRRLRRPGAGEPVRWPAAAGGAGQGAGDPSDRAAAGRAVLQPGHAAAGADPRGGAAAARRPRRHRRVRHPRPGGGVRGGRRGGGDARRPHRAADHPGRAVPRAGVAGGGRVPRRRQPAARRGRLRPGRHSAGAGAAPRRPARRRRRAAAAGAAPRGGRPPGDRRRGRVLRARRGLPDPPAGWRRGAGAGARRPRVPARRPGRPRLRGRADRRLPACQPLICSSSAPGRPGSAPPSGRRGLGTGWWSWSAARDRAARPAASSSTGSGSTTAATGSTRRSSRASSPTCAACSARSCSGGPATAASSWRAAGSGSRCAPPTWPGGCRRRSRPPRPATPPPPGPGGPGPTPSPRCERFYFPYARKLWGLDPSELAGEQARRRVTAGSPARLLARVARGAGGGGAFFWYPRRGFGTIGERLAEAAAAAGAELRFGAAAERVWLGDRGRATVTLAGGETVTARRVWSTIPLPVLARIAEPAPPASLLAAAGRLDFRAMLLVYLVLDGGRYSPYDAHYLPDPGTPVTRVSEPTNYRDGDDPRDRTVLCAELPCERGGELWRAADGELAGLVRATLRDRGLPEPTVRAVAVRRLPAVYPVYRVGYGAAFDALDAWAAAQAALLSFGRLGLFVHDNTHHALAMAWAAADALAPDGGFDHHAWAAARARFAGHVVED